MKKSRKIWIWVLGIVIAAGVVAFVRNRAAGDDLVVQLVDKETKEPIKNVRVTFYETEGLPVISNFDFLPENFRVRTSSRTIESPDGRFRARRVIAFQGGPHRARFVVEADSVLWADVAYEDGVFQISSSAIHRPGDAWDASYKFAPVPNERAIVIPLDRPKR